jgi:hypothetical protein
MIIKDNAGKVGNEIIATVFIGAFVFSVIVYVVLSLITDWIVGIIGAIVVFTLMFAYISSKIGKYEK